MTATDQTTASPEPPRGADPTRRAGVPGVLATAAIASLGAGAIHATAAGSHSDHRAAVVAFVITATAQIGWGAWALRRSVRLVNLAGAAINAAAVGGWLLAKSNGISFVAGLDVKESPGFADSLAATLAAVAVIGALLSLDRRSSFAAATNRVLASAAALATVALVIPGMVATSNHSHDTTAHDHGTALTPPVPYTGKLPVDLSGVPGVSPQQQAEAEALVTATILKLPQFADIASDQAKGYHSIGDAETGYEHFINWSLVNDGRMLDPDYPESLVFQVDPATGKKTLAAAMFMANPGTTLDTVPPIGGALVQWHVHDDLCFRGQTNAWRVAGVVGADGKCRPGTFSLGTVPMVHVWIVATPCGPFAALEGLGAGQIKPGEQRLCDHVHGTTN
ncbi:MAG TPA: hypothetical protein VH561_10865 [Micromonosporaceae bacterium]